MHAKSLRSLEQQLSGIHHGIGGDFADMPVVCRILDKTREQAGFAYTMLALHNQQQVAVLGHVLQQVQALRTLGIKVEKAVVVKIGKGG